MWTKELPQDVKMTVSGYKLKGKTTLLYKKLAVKAKTYGNVYKENDNACIIIQKNKNGLIIVNTGSEVWAMVKNAESLHNENIEQYTHNTTYSNEDIIEEVLDTLCADTSPIDYEAAYGD